MLVVAGQRFVQTQQCIVLEQLVAGDGNFTAQIEQFVLHIDQHGAHILGQRFAQQQADVRVQLVHIAHGMRAGAVLGNPGVVAQAGGAIVAGARGNL